MSRSWSHLPCFICTLLAAQAKVFTGVESFEVKTNLVLSVYECEEKVIHFLGSDRSSSCLQKVSDLEHVLMVYYSFRKGWVEMHAWVMKGVVLMVYPSKHDYVLSLMCLLGCLGSLGPLCTYT